MPSRHPDFDKIVRAYRDRYGVDLSHMRMKWSKHPADTPKKKFDSELFAEYMANQMNKKAQAVDRDKWPEYSDYQKRHHDRTIEAVRKIIVDDYTRRGEWGLLTRSGRILGGKDLTDDRVSRAVIRSGMEARRARRANCHELAAAILDKLREKGITARRILVDKDQYNGVPMGHSTVMFQGDDGRWHRATGGMKRGKKSRLGDFDSLEDAIDQYIAVEKANGQTTDDERVEAFDTTDLPFTDRMPWPEYKALARTGRRLYHQEKKAQAYETPWTIDQIRKNLGDEIADRLAKDPVHKWRSDTGIELVHKEPTKEELLRIIENWRLMDALKKRRSNRKSKELFGMTNLQHAKELLGQ